MPSIINIETRLPLYLKAGVTAGFPVGGKSYTNAVSDSNSSLAGWDFTLEIPVYGTLTPGVDYEFDGEETITLLDDQYQTGNGEKWVIHFLPKSSDTPVPSTTQTLYSNGYRVADVMTALMNRRRWRQPTRSDFPFTLTGNNVWAGDDLYSPTFEAIHKVVTPFNVWQVQDDDGIDQAGFNEYLQQLQRDVVLKCLNSVFNKREHLEKKLMFDRLGMSDVLAENSGKFVCVRIGTAKAFDVSTQIDNVSLRFNANITFNLYLYHDSQPGVPVMTKSVTAVGGETTVVNIGHVLSYAGSGFKSGGYYLGYFQNDLGNVKAYNEMIGRFTPKNYFSCIPAELKTAGSGINVDEVSFTDQTHGFNVQLSAFRDFTQLIVDNSHLFDNLIGLQMAADVIELVQNTTRSDLTQRITGELTKALYTDLNLAGPTEDNPFSAGLKVKIQNEARRVKYEFFPKDKKSININLAGSPEPARCYN